MKSLRILILAAGLSTGAMAQSTALPETIVKNLDNNAKVAFNKAIAPGRVTLISFWATWCIPCKKEIKNVRAKMGEWRQEADFDYITVSIDESRAEGLVRSYAKSQGWDFPYYIDPNSDLKRSLNFQTVPFTIIVDKKGQVAYMKTGYEEGAEAEAFAKLKELSAAE